MLANGTKITMSQVAARAGVAKATLYNHYRAREDVLADLLLVEIDSIIAAVEHLSLSAALHRAAVAVSEHPLLEALGAQDSAALSALAMIDVRTAGWARVGQAVDRMLAAPGPSGYPDRAAVAVVVSHCAGRQRRHRSRRRGAGRRFTAGDVEGVRRPG